MASRFTFASEGVEISSVADGTVNVGIASGLTIPENTYLFIALYKKDGSLDYIDVFDSAVRVDLTMDADTARIAAYLWTTDFRPVDAKSIKAD